MFTFRLDKKQFDKILPLCGNYVDIVYFNSKVIIASEDGICYSQLMFDAVADDPNQKRIGFRVETAILKRLAVNGRIGVYCSDTEVQLSMYGEGQEVIYKSSTPMMNSFLEFSEISDIINKFDDYNYCHISTESTVIKLASKFNEVFVSEPRFGYICHNNSYIFCKSDLPPFCVDGRALKNVSSISARFKLIDNYLIFLEGNTLIKLTRNRMPLTSDLEFLVNSKAIAKYQLNFKRANYLINSLGAEEYTSELNLTVNKLLVRSNKGSFESKVEIINENKKELTLEEKLKALEKPNPIGQQKSLIDRVIKIPKWVFSVISDYSNITIYVKRNSCLVQFGTSYLVFSGGFVNEV